jgi:hypothetical protein
MSTLKNRVLPVVIGAAVVVGAANVAAYAADGHALLLGHLNSEAHTATVVDHGPGPALSLTTRDDVPPLEVSSQAKVRRLNADRVDGVNGGDVTALDYQMPQVFGASSFSISFPGLPNNRRYVASYWVATDMTVGNDGISCALDATKRTGDPGGESLGITESPHDFLATAAATTFISTHNRFVTLDCSSESNSATIDSLYDGQVIFTPVGKQRIAAGVAH